MLSKIKDVLTALFGKAEREIIICENCYLSGYVGEHCTRCDHMVGKQAGSHNGPGPSHTSGGPSFPARLSDGPSVKMSFIETLKKRKHDRS